MVHGTARVALGELGLVGQAVRALDLDLLRPAATRAVGAKPEGRICHFMARTDVR